MSNVNSMLIGGKEVDTAYLDGNLIYTRTGTGLPEWVFNYGRPLQYITGVASTGTANRGGRIGTGLIVNADIANNLRIKGKMIINDAYAQFQFMGINGPGVNIAVGVINESGILKYFVPKFSGYDGITPTSPLGVGSIIDFDIDFKNSTWKYNDLSGDFAKTDFDPDASIEYPIGGFFSVVNNNFSGLNNSIINWQIFVNDVLSYDYISLEFFTNDEAGLFNLIDQSFETSTTLDEFIKGPYTVFEQLNQATQALNILGVITE